MGQDSNSCLTQLKSKSQASQALVTMESASIDTGETMLRSSDTGTILWNTGMTMDAPANYIRLTREWRVTESNGDVGTVTVSVNDPELSYPDGSLVLLVNSTNDLTNGTLVPMTSSG